MTRENQKTAFLVTLGVNNVMRYYILSDPFI
jgi:hypothetical protein